MRGRLIPRRTAILKIGMLLTVLSVALAMAVPGLRWRLQVSAMKLTGLLSELEYLGASGQIEPMSELIDQLQEEWIRCKQHTPLEWSSVSTAD